MWTINFGIYSILYLINVVAEQYMCNKKKKIYYYKNFIINTNL